MRFNSTFGENRFAHAMSGEFKWKIPDEELGTVSCLGWKFSTRLYKHSLALHLGMT